METVKLTGILLFGIAFATATATTYVACDNCTDRANTSVLAGIELILYPNATTDVNVTVSVANALDLISHMDLDKPTIVYLFGWTESSKCTSVDTILGAYCEAQNFNVILVNWGTIAAEDYYYAAYSVSGIGYTVATALNKLVASGVSSSTLRIVGHSLGAQISGYIGKNVNFTLARITGLDPAGPGFTEGDASLCSTDAGFVEIIHTNPGCAGIDYSAGHVDFWPNVGSSTQPGCENDNWILACSCSHSRSWEYYVEAFINNYAYLGVACDSATEFEAGTCAANATAYMGYITSTSASGNFDLQTNSAAPYGRGVNGTTYYASL